MTRQDHCASYIRCRMIQHRSLASSCVHHRVVGVCGGGEKQCKKFEDFRKIFKISSLEGFVDRFLILMIFNT